jgi:hypothetical protein
MHSILRKNQSGAGLAPQLQRCWLTQLELKPQPAARA